MKILITGSNGFIGKNLISHLKELSGIEIITFEKEDSFSKIEDSIFSIDFIFHLAGVNRPDEIIEFYEGNTDLTKSLIALIEKNNLNIPILYTSSIQAELDNDYGKSKKLAEDIILDYGKTAEIFIYRLHNVFGKWSRPNYNSVVATFCYNIANHMEIQINDPSKEIELVYIDDVIEEFIKVFTTIPSSKTKIFHIQKSYKITLSDLANMLFEFKNDMKSISVPNTGDDFTKKLYSTFVSYVPLEELIFSAKQHKDERGSFVEVVRTKECGQFSFSASQIGISRGHHYHHTKLERFIVVKGTAQIEMKNILTNETHQFMVSDSDIKIITIPVGWTHSITNIGEEEMLLLIWCNELYEEKYPDTYSMKVR